MQKNDHIVRGDYLVAAFEDAWMRALKGELVTSDNVATAPAELIRFLLVSLDEAEGHDAVTLGRTAFAKWCTKAETTLDTAPPEPGDWLH